MSRTSDDVPSRIWERGGATTHPGGMDATRRLLARSPLQPRQRLLELGCGTGMTAVRLARFQPVRLVGVDRSWRNLQAARRRAVQAGLPLALVHADARQLPFARAAFDGVLAESVLVFGSARHGLAEAFRVLRPGGWLALNELTLLSAPPIGLAALLARMGIRHAWQATDWSAALAGAGFVQVTADCAPLRLRLQLSSHMQDAGLKGYLRSVARTLGDPAIRRQFLNRDTLRAAQRYRRLIGYGLYTARKPEAANGRSAPPR